MYSVNRQTNNGSYSVVEDTFLEALESLWSTLAVLFELGYVVEYDETTGTFLASYKRNFGRPEAIWKLSIQEVASPVDSVSD